VTKAKCIERIHESIYRLVVNFLTAKYFFTEGFRSCCTAIDQSPFIQSYNAFHWQTTPHEILLFNIFFYLLYLPFTV